MANLVLTLDLKALETADIDSGVLITTLVDDLELIGDS